MISSGRVWNWTRVSVNARFISQLFQHLFILSKLFQIQSMVIYPFIRNWRCLVNCNFDWLYNVSIKNKVCN